MGLALSASPFVCAAIVAHGAVPQETQIFTTVYATHRTLRATPTVSIGTRNRVDRGRRSVTFWLPAGSHQGGSTWYILDAHIRIRFGVQSTKTSVSEVGVAMNGRLVAGIDIIRGAFQGRPAIRWSSGETFTGPSSGLDLGNKLEVHFKNYLQVQGVRPGKNTFTFQVVKIVGNDAVRDAELLPGTRIAVTPLGPPSLRVSAVVDNARVLLGAPLVLHYRVTSVGWPARQTGLIIATTSPALSIDGPPARLLGWASKVQGTVVLKALVPGRYNITVRAEGETGGIASKTVAIAVVRRP